MQKVFVSAGAVGAAALELNNNQASNNQIAEAAPHGVQQRRGSKSKKEEAILIQREHATIDKAKHGKASRKLNGGQTFWLIVVIIAVLAALGFGLGFGLQGGCPSLDHADKTVCSCGVINCDLKTYAEYETFEGLECTSIEGTLTLGNGVLRDAKAETLEFNHLIEITNGGSVFALDDNGAWVTKRIKFNKLVQIGGTFTLGVPDFSFFSTKSEGDSLESVHANCLQSTGVWFTIVNVFNLKEAKFDNLEFTGSNPFGVSGAYILGMGRNVEHASFSFPSLTDVFRLWLVYTDSAGKKVTFHFGALKRILTDFSVIFPIGGPCTPDLLVAKFKSVADITIRSAFFIYSNDDTGTKQPGKLQFDHLAGPFTSKFIQDSGVRSEFLTSTFVVPTSSLPTCS